MSLEINNADFRLRLKAIDWLNTEYRCVLIGFGVAWVVTGNADLVFANDHPQLQRHHLPAFYDNLSGLFDTASFAGEFPLGRDI